MTAVVFLNAELLSRLSNAKKLKDVWRTLFYLMANIDMHNVVKEKISDMADRLDIKASTMRSHLKQLEELNVIETDDERGCIYISPHLAWKGSEQSHRKALKACVKPLPATF